MDDESFQFKHDPALLLKNASLLEDALQSNHVEEQTQEEITSLLADALNKLAEESRPGGVTDNEDLPLRIIEREIGQLIQTARRLMRQTERELRLNQHPSVTNTTRSAVENSSNKTMIDYFDTGPRQRRLLILWLFDEVCDPESEDLGAFALDELLTILSAERARNKLTESGVEQFAQTSVENLSYSQLQLIQSAGSQKGRLAAEIKHKPLSDLSSHVVKEATELFTADTQKELRLGYVADLLRNQVPEPVMDSQTDIPKIEWFRKQVKLAPNYPEYASKPGRTKKEP